MMKVTVTVNDAVFAFEGENDIACDECGAICDSDKLAGWRWASDELTDKDKQCLLCPACVE